MRHFLRYAAQFLATALFRYRGELGKIVIL
jgi:hypothetical protein